VTGSIDLDPNRGMKVTMMLADSAQVAEGKLYVMGGGWTVTGPEPSPFALAGIVEVPWHLTDEEHVLRFELIDLDGSPVMVPTPDGDAPFFIEAKFEVGRPPGTRPGATLSMPFAFNNGPLQLPPGSDLECRYTINGEPREDWRLAFSTRPEGAQPFAT
jgi:hypothetical protein